MHVDLGHPSFLSRSIIKRFPKRQSFKLKEFADDNFKLDENDSKFPKREENTGKRRNYEQFLFFPHRFQETCNCRHVQTRPCLGKG